LEVILVGILTGLYVLMFLYFTIGILRARKPQGVPATPGVTVVVPLHNEESCVLRTLGALEAQQYGGEWEVICVNDRSSDRTRELLEAYTKDHPRFRVLNVPMDSPPLPSPKKRALEVGFAEARFEILATMDADCTPSPTWLSSMAGCFQGNIGIVQGGKRNNGGNTPLFAYQKLDTLGFTLIEAAGFSMGKPMLASAAAMAYRKDLFYKVGGFSDLMQYTSGDDDMLVHKMIREPVEFCYNMDPYAIIDTEPVYTWKGLLNQRARWASNGTNYANPLYVLFLTLIYCFYVWLFVGPVFAITGIVDWEHWLDPLMAKVIIDILFLSIGGYRLRLLHLVLWLPIVEIVQIPLIAIAVPMGSIFKKFKWK
jgi:cellulose synthase/poly-beta-1,6-N-acetylglucosamine synthase-like glycosyltransferase